MRRAASGLATRSRPSICLLCHITPRPPSRSFSTTTTRLREKPKGKANVRYTGKFDSSALPLRYTNNGSAPPLLGETVAIRPWSTNLLKERLGAVYKRDPEDPNMRIIWGDEATNMRKQDPARFKSLFRDYIDSIRLAVGLDGQAQPDTPLHVLEAMKDVKEFKKMYAQGGLTALDVALMDTFIMKKYDTSNCVSAQRNLANFSHPAEWFPKTRTLSRTWHLHVGPTNSGKTYNALKRLEEADSGIYCGPLRLLAHEVYTRLNAKGIPCNLITGEERRVQEDVELYSSTVEMTCVEKQYDVAVIDEIQMLSDPERGWAWTHAVLGVMAKELHLCGEDRSVEIVKKLAKLCGDELIIHRYQRLGKLEVMDRSLEGDFTKIEKGDCVVGFSRKDIHTLKSYIEQKTGLRCAVVYGALPAETRATQAKYFNDPQNDYDVLVASDAVGLGLNLSIKRVIFSTMYKYNGKEQVVIPVPLTRQIAGRAGRYRSSADDSKKTAVAPPSVEGSEGWETAIAEALVEPPPPTSIPSDGKTGYTTTFVERDLGLLRENMNTEPPPIEQAIVLPRNTVVENYCALFPANTPFWQILAKMGSQADVSELFKFSNIKPMIDVAKLLEPTEDEVSKGNDVLSHLSDIEKINLSLAPVKLNIEACVKAFREFARVIAQGKRSTLLTISRKIIDIEALDVKAEQPEIMIKRLEELHTVIMLYAWCQQRFRHTLTGEDITQRLKEEVETKIDEAMKKGALDKANARGVTQKSRFDPRRDRRSNGHDFIRRATDSRENQRYRPRHEVN
ncbi:hypothetical protein H072_10492 [Dactylellina haptotyla CBS 200.50]|uniref:RNA helicase n=1 Tax=Dactylellina haptotyla (strain CBS 200.50) TaxID=1284197 RepID=S8A077_DACHA|nr:hypothetical protein H072_10492 [Dactylellina haptotyla CBS 200.50]